MVEIARRKGQDWSVHEIPPGRGSNFVGVALRRLTDLIRTRVRGHGFEILHINYGVSGYYGWFRKGVVLHLHGSDVRQDLQSTFLGPIVRFSIQTADLVLYSTPDMARLVHGIRADALWFPAPLPPQAEMQLAPSHPRDGHHVFFASRWDDSKGGRELVDLAKNLKAIRPELNLAGLKWGSYQDEAAEAGVDLIAPMSTADFRQQLANADVVIGQLAYGVLGLSDLEAMAQGRPVVAKFTAAAAYGSGAPIANTSTGDPLDLVLELLDDGAKAKELGIEARRWALRHHAASALENRLEQLYKLILDRLAEISPG